MPKRLDGTLVTDGFNFDGANTVTTDHDVTKILPDEDNKIDLGSPSKKFKNIYYSSLTPDPGTGYLPLTGGTMSGAINMGSQEINNCTGFRVSTNSILIGDSKTSNDGISSVVVGPNSQISNSSSSTIIGYGSQIANSISSLAVGTGSSINGARSSVALGPGATIAGQYGVAVGWGSGVNSSMQTGVALGYQAIVAANNAISLGANTNNSQANSLLVGSSSNIRSSSTTCDLGTTVNPFQSLYITNIYSNGPLNLGTATATSVNIGRTGQLVNVNGNLSTPNAVTAKGMVLSGTKYLQRSFGTAFSNSTAETSWFAGVATSSGTLRFNPSTTNLGLCLKFTGHAMMTMTGGGTLTFRFRCSSYTQILGSILFTPAAFTAQLVRFSVTMFWTTINNTVTCIEVAIPGQTIQSSYTANNLWYGGNTNDIDATLQFSTASANNSFRSYTGLLESINDS